MLEERGSILHTAHTLYIYSGGKLLMLFYYHCKINSTFKNMLSTAYIFINIHIYSTDLYTNVHTYTQVFAALVCRFFLKKIE